MIARPVDPKKGRKRQISGGGKNASAIVTQSQTPKRRKTGDAEPSFASAASKGTTAPTVTSSTRRQRTSTSAEAIDDSSSKDGDGGGITVTQPVGHYVDEDGKEIWICPACGEQYNHLPMICCDRCDEWYVWMCVDRYWPKNTHLKQKHFWAEMASVTKPAKILKPGILSVTLLYSVSYKRLRECHGQGGPSFFPCIDRQPVATERPPRPVQRSLSLNQLVSQPQILSHLKYIRKPTPQTWKLLKIDLSVTNLRSVSHSFEPGQKFWGKFRCTM